MNETRSTYLRRIEPDLALLANDVWTAIASESSDYYTKSAVARAKKLLEDLERAYATPV